MITGRPIKPTALRVLDGHRKDSININEPKPLISDTEFPEWLSDRSKENYYTLGTELK